MEQKFKGMTVNERLFVSGLIDEFDQAVNRKDTNRVREILYEVELNEDNIKPILIRLKLPV